MTWYKEGVFLRDMDLQNFEVRVDEVTHYDLMRSDGKKICACCLFQMFQTVEFNLYFEY